jgi:hypothetical protein
LEAVLKPLLDNHQRNERIKIFAAGFSACRRDIFLSGAAAIFVDNAARVVYGQRYFSGKNVDQAIFGFISEVMSAIRATYHREAETAWRQGIKFPAADPTMSKIRNVIIEKVQEHEKL